MKLTKVQNGGNNCISHTGGKKIKKNKTKNKKKTHKNNKKGKSKKNKSSKKKRKRPKKIVMKGGKSIPFGELGQVYDGATYQVSKVLQSLSTPNMSASSNPENSVVNPSTSVQFIRTEEPSYIDNLNLKDIFNKNL